MGRDRKGARFCDNCGRGIDKAVRIHLGKDYCRSCYQTNFIKVACSQCSGSMRSHRLSTADPVCPACARVGRTCSRCNRLLIKADLIVAGRAVCKPCAHHFKLPKPCTVCGELSTQLSTALAVGIETPACQRCRRALTHATCCCCRKHRKIADRTFEGLPRCSACVSGQEHACPGCGAVVAGGGLSRCLACTNKDLLRKESQMVLAELEQAWTRKLWEGFVDQELMPSVSNPNARKFLLHAASFFKSVETSFGGVAEITESSLVQKLGSACLRAHLKASRYLVKAVGLHDFTQQRVLVRDQRRVEQALHEVDGTACHGLLADYVRCLQGRNLAAHTIRVYLRAAIDFCTEAKLTPQTPAGFERLQEHLAKTPGNWASLGVFARHCARRYGWPVSMPPKDVIRNPGDRTMRQMRSLRDALAAVKDIPVERLSSQAVARILSLALNVPAVELKRVRSEGGAGYGVGGAVILGADATISPGHELYPYAHRWVSLADRAAHAPK